MQQGLAVENWNFPTRTQSGKCVTRSDCVQRGWSVFCEVKAFAARWKRVEWRR